MFIHVIHCKNFSRLYNTVALEIILKKLDQKKLIYSPKMIDPLIRRVFKKLLNDFITHLLYRNIFYLTIFISLILILYYSCIENILSRIFYNLVLLNSTKTCVEVINKSYLLNFCVL